MAEGMIGQKHHTRSLSAGSAKSGSIKLTNSLGFKAIDDFESSLGPSQRISDEQSLAQVGKLLVIDDEES